MMPWTSFKYTLSQAENYVGSFSCTAKELVSQVTGQGHSVHSMGKKRSLKKRRCDCFLCSASERFCFGVLAKPMQAFL